MRPKIPIVEYHDSDTQILLIGQRDNPLVGALISYFTKQKQKVTVSGDIPDTVSEQVTLCFCFTDVHHLEADTYSLLPLPKVICVVSTDDIHGHIPHLKMIEKHCPHMKFVLLKPGVHPVDEFTKRLLYFAFDESPTRFLQLENLRSSHTHTPRSLHSRPHLISWKEWYIGIVSRPLRFIMVTLSVLVCAHILFLVPLFLSFGGLIISTPTITTRDDIATLTSSSLFRSSEISFRLADRLYSWSRPALSTLGFSSYSDRLVSVPRSIYTLVHTGQSALDHAGIISAKIFDPQTLSQDQIREHIGLLGQDINLIDEQLSLIESQVPARFLTYRRLDTQLIQAKAILTKARVILPVLPTALGDKESKTYVVFFANNYELRPGGGFIGSFALIRFAQLQLKDWKVYDVYDADGQLKARVAPPTPISTYLGQPFYFLRDSAFTGDFPTNVLTAEDFLQKELAIEQVDGAILMTSRALETLLGGIGPLTIPEYRETVTKDNVYLKTQLYAEKRTFAGSIQKKDFIDALFTQILLKITEPPAALAAFSSLESAFNAKQAVAYSKEPEVQSIFDQWFWSGRQLPYSCLKGTRAQADCTLDYVYPLEANLGVNKANRFIDRRYERDITIDIDGKISSSFTATWYNKSYPDTYPGGAYKNYYQIVLPPDVTIQKVVLDNTLLTTYDVTRDQYTTIGVYFEIAPRTRRIFTISYLLPDTIKKDTSQLQLLIQKQIGTPAVDVTTRIRLPDSMSVIDANVSPLAGGRLIEYNSTIDSDKFYYFTF